MKKILFHCDSLGFRGVTNATIDYAEYNQSVLGNESTIVYNAAFDATKGLDIGSNQDVINLIKSKYKVVSYTNNKELNDIAANYDLFYTLRGGLKEDFNVTTCKTAVHVVFQFFDPHGDVYAYISEFLSNEVTGGKSPFVPHVVDMPQPNPESRKSLREFMKIPEDNFVFGRLGGLYTFDKDFVKSAIIDIVNERDDITFVLVNTHRFYDHPNIIHVEPLFERQIKSDYVSMCDGMIHARNLGESFGLSICDFLFHDKPVLSWEGGFDRNHVLMLKDYDLLYNENNVKQKMIDLKNKPKMDYKGIVAPYTPEKVMAKFNEVFIK